MRVVRRKAGWRFLSRLDFPQLSVASPRRQGYAAGMSILAEDSPVIEKTKELCAQIASDPSFLKLQADVERFLSDDSSRLQYQSVH